MENIVLWLFVLVISIPVLSLARSIVLGKDEPVKPYRAYTTEFDVVCRSSEIASVLGPLDPASESEFEDALALFGSAWRTAFDSSQAVLRDTVETSSAAIGADGLADTAVTILIDHSGSMRGEKIQTAAIASALIAEYLGQLGVSHEILGFTTVRWKGGKSRETWFDNGRPLQPGRLNDLLHIIYKEHDGIWTRIDDTAFQTMLRPRLLKENIDGEALLWALDRLKALSARRRLIIVISDGAPVDDSTLASNDKDILHNHVKYAVGIVAENDIDILGVGIHHDVGPYYGNALSLEVSEVDWTRFLEAIARTFVSTGTGAAAVNGEADPDIAKTLPSGDDPS